MSSNEIVVTLSEGDPEHIVVDKSPLCSAENDEDFDIHRMVPSDKSPIYNGSLNLCPTCIEEWEENHIDDPREDTIDCECHRFEDGMTWKCNKTITVHEARALNHEQSDGKIAVCEDCYSWIRNAETNDVETEYADAETWASHEQSKSQH